MYKKNFGLSKPSFLKLFKMEEPPRLLFKSQRSPSKDYYIQSSVYISVMVGGINVPYICGQ